MRLAGWESHDGLILWCVLARYVAVVLALLVLSLLVVGDRDGRSLRSWSRFFTRRFFGIFFCRCVRAA